ncbi:type II toxin-antitoxin system Phd/YefM family antitoxin [Actinomycetospora cinnamomea]|uniref:Antitoxin n=1 Tax=Actinomycetospora cinnamomea TaxID=663609 RepID=A0A2U1F7I8_9PSEU|nr:type II toxin-antitoxin system prevent-host-death family antitoxin [Actinomycetospora cinnamomea]PVZ08155.1 prevent-host-death family protein [Actinomycetospora cinnamomea]
MEQVGLRELRQNASELVRRVEAGERIEVTVSGRPSALLVPTESHRWRVWQDVADVFAGAGDPDWESDRALIDQEMQDPWAAR